MKVKRERKKKYRKDISETERPNEIEPEIDAIKKLFTDKRCVFESME